MSTSIQLPEAIKEFVESRAAEGGFATTDDYIVDVLRGEQKRLARARLQAAIDEGLDSGPPKAVTPQFWESVRQEVEAGEKSARGE